MSQIHSIEGSMQYSQGRFAIVCARFNGFVVESLVAGAVDTLKRSGVEESAITVVKTPGAFEIPVVVQGLAQTGNYNAIIALGAVIRGATPHFDIVANESAKGLSAAGFDRILATVRPKDSSNAGPAPELQPTCGLNTYGDTQALLF